MPVANLPADAKADLWVFGYGSLMWRPGFAYEERSPGTIRGYHRALCIFSHVHRGTEKEPGLVLGLSQGPLGVSKFVLQRFDLSQRLRSFDHVSSCDRQYASQIQQRTEAQSYS